MTKKERTGIILAYIMQFLIFISIFISLYKGRYNVSIDAVIALFITFLPAIIKKKWNVSLPWTLNLLIAISLYLHIGGETFDFYIAFYPFYDKFGHFLGSLTVALLGFASVIIVDKYSNLKLSKNHIIFFIIIFTMAIGAFWEISEFLTDVSIGTKKQFGLNDTMLDMIFNFIGSLVIAIITNINFETMKENIVKVEKKD